MSNRISKKECPCCHAPLEDVQQDANLVRCNRCGAEIILKLPLDERIEQFVMEELFTFNSIQLAFVLLFSQSFLGLLLWKFWLRDSGYLDSNWICALILLACLSMDIFVCVTIHIQQTAKKRCLEECGYSLERLKQLNQVQPTFVRTNLLKEIEEKIDETKLKLDL